MGGPNKLLAQITGKPLARIAADAALASQARPVVVVTGHQSETIADALRDLPLQFAHNPDFAEGLSTSLRAGLGALPDDIDGAVVMLADMPQVDAALIERLTAAYDAEKGALIAVPVIDGKRGNPVLWSRRFFPELMALSGDVGARHLIAKYSEAVVEVPVTGTGALVDVDTPEALDAVKAELERG
jgi:molybdenum cofactor cytidylyltransferase